MNIEQALGGMVASALLLGGCAALPAHDKSYASTPPRPAVIAPENAGSIYQPGHSVALFEDLKARRVGDTLTIVLSESTSASKNAKTNTKKENSVDIANPTILGSSPQFNAPGFIPLASNRNNTLETGIDSTKEFKGEADSSQGNSLRGNVTVTVAEVLPNGNLVVRGEKRLTLNQGDEYVRISGIVRPIDIRSDNSVPSSQVADARIIYTGTGALADTNSMGWLARLFNSGWWPF